MNKSITLDITTFVDVNSGRAGTPNRLLWSTFVQEFQDHHIVSKKEQAPAFVMAKFKEPHTRSSDNVVSYSAITLDFDDGTEWDDLLNDEALAPYEWVCASSFSNTADLQRFRVVIPLQTPVDVDTYRDCRAAMLKMFVGADPASFNVSQAFYAPSRSRNTKDFFSYHNKGKILNFIDIELCQLDIEIEEDLALVRKYGVARKPADRSLGGYEEPTLEDAKQLLDLIDAGVPRNEWIKIGSILKKTFGDEARDLFIEWSMTKDYKDNTPDKLTGVWNSLSSTMKPSYGSLVYLAREGGANEI